MATLKRQNANGEWEIIQLTGEDVNKIKIKLEEIEGKILDGSIGENIPPIEIHEHLNKEALDKISEDIEGNLLFNGETISADDSSFLVQGTKPNGIEEGRIWVDTSENTYQGIDVNGINYTLDRLNKDNEMNKTDILNNKNHSINNKNITSLEGIHGIRYYNGKLSIMVNNSWIEFQLDNSNSDVDVKKLETAIQSLKLDNTTNKQDIKTIKDFISTDITTIEGKHGIRYYENKLSIKVDGKWVEFKNDSGGNQEEENGGGSSVDGSGLALDGVSRFTIEVASGKNVLYWTEPEKNILINGQVVASWSGTRVLRKVGSFPVDENDGTIVVTNRVHNQYSRKGFVDLGLENGTEYYYSIFPYTNYGTFSEKKNAKGRPIAQKIYGVRIDKDNSNWDSRVSYIKDATSFTPVTINYDTYSKEFLTDWGSWESVYNSFNIRPCLLKNGIVNYYLNPNDYNQKTDGTPSDVATGNDGDVMVEFGKTLWWKFTDEGNLSYTVEISDMAFEGAVKHAFEIEEGYNPFSYYPFLLLQIISMLFFKSTNPAPFGSSRSTYNGEANTNGVIFKTSSYHKFLGIENLVLGHTFIDGIVVDSNGDIIIKKNNLGSTDYFNESTHLKLTKEYDNALANTDSNYFLSTLASNEGGFLPKKIGGGNTTYYGSYASYGKQTLGILNGDSMFSLVFRYSATSSFYSRLFYSRNGKIYIGAYSNILLDRRLRSITYNGQASIIYQGNVMSFSQIKANNDYVI